MYGFFARLDAIFHKIRHPKHKVMWRCSIEKDLYAGDITCETCNIIYWCRGAGYKLFNKGWAW